MIKEHSTPLKLRREECEAELEKLIAQQLAMVGLEQREEQVEDYCLRMRENLDSLGFEEKRTALKALKIKAVVTTTEVQVRGILGVEPDLATIEQTSG